MTKPWDKVAERVAEQGWSEPRLCTSCEKRKPEDEFSGQCSKYKNTGRCLECKRKSDAASYRKHREARLAWWRTHYKENHERVRAQNRRSVDKIRIGTDRIKIVTEESECERCGMTQVEHMERWGLSLNIHHNDGCGRAALNRGEKPNNDPNNLSILCQRCHTREHNLLRVNRSYDDPGRMRKAWETRRKRYGVSGGNA